MGMMMNELKPCPFCGGKAKCLTNDHPMFQIGCPVCNIYSGILYEESQAITLWNTRHNNREDGDQ